MKTTKTKRKEGSGLKARILITKARVGRHFLFYFKNHAVYYKVRKIKRIFIKCTSPVTVFTSLRNLTNNEYDRVKD